MTKKQTEQPSIDAFLDVLKATHDTPVPKGGFGRTTRMLKTAVGTGLSVATGRFRGRGDGGLNSADVRAIERMVRNLGELKGLAMKMGQIFSYVDVSLPPEMRALLSLLQTQSQPAPWSAVEGIVQEELGPRAHELLEHMDHTPFSVASIGQVHRGTLPDGTQVAVKVLHPGIREALTSDFNAARIGPVVARLFMPGSSANMKSFMTEMRDRMMEECDYSLEAERQQLFSRLLQDIPGVVVPQVHLEWCSHRVLVTTFEQGLSLDEMLARNPDSAWRTDVGERLFQIYFGTLYRHGWFHADPHPGNYAFRPDGTLVVYDFGCTRQFDSDTVKALSTLAHAVAGDKPEELREAMGALGGEIPPDDKAYQHVRKLLRSFFSPMLTPGPHVMDAGVNMNASEIFQDKRMLMRLQIPGRLLFLFRIRFGLYAVLARLEACSDWSKLEKKLADECLGSV